MGNRVIEQKRLKDRRMRKAWAKPFERKSGITPNRIVINEYKERALGLALDEAAADKIAAKLLGQQEIFKGVPPGRVDAEAKIMRLRQAHPGLNQVQIEALHQKMRVLQRQGELEAVLGEAYLRISGPGPSNTYQESFTYFNAQKNMWRVLHRDLKKRVERLSIVYESKEALMIRWTMDKITWIEQRPIVPA